MEMAASISKQHKLCFSTIKCPIYFTPVAWLELHVTELKLHTDSRMLSSLLRDGFRFRSDRRLTKEKRSQAKHMQVEHSRDMYKARGVHE